MCAAEGGCVIGVIGCGCGVVGGVNAVDAAAGVVRADGDVVDDEVGDGEDDGVVADAASCC